RGIFCAGLWGEGLGVDGGLRGSGAADFCIYGARLKRGLGTKTGLECTRDWARFSERGIDLGCLEGGGLWDDEFVAADRGRRADAELVADGIAAGVAAAGDVFGNIGRASFRRSSRTTRTSGRSDERDGRLEHAIAVSCGGSIVGRWDGTGVCAVAAGIACAE